jgi:putative alpha-1,2-mannosidase
MFRFTFPEGDSSFILLDAFNKGSMVKVVPSDKKVIGYCRNSAGGVPEDFHIYFVVIFDRDFMSVQTWHGDTLDTNLIAGGSHTGALLGFKTVRGEKINVRVASSFISPEQAEINLERETGGKPSFHYGF